MSEFIREVEEEVRREQQLKLWRKYGSYVISAGIGVIVIASSIVGWRNYQQSQRLADSAEFSAAAARSQAGDLAAAVDAFTRLRDVGGAYAALAALREARARFDTDDMISGLAALDLLATDGDSDPELRQIANIAAIIQMMNSGNFPGIEDRLADLSGGGNNWLASARELQGLLALQRGNIDEARRVFTELKDDPSITPGVRGRAGELLAALGGSGE